jgi:hypothetical protein
VPAGGGGNNMLMVSACQTAVKLTWQPASQVLQSLFHAECLSFTYS